MKKLHLVIIVATIPFVSACSSVPSIWEVKYGPDKPQFSYVHRSDGNSDTSKNAGGIYIWNPNTTTAYTNAAGSACIQPADVYRVNSSLSSGKIAADAAGSKITGANAEYLAQTAQAAMLLANQDAKGTFLSVALFNLCMLSMNSMIDASSASKLFSEALKEAANMPSPTFPPINIVTSPSNGTPQTTPAPKPDGAGKTN